MTIAHGLADETDGALGRAFLSDLHVVASTIHTAQLSPDSKVISTGRNRAMMSALVRACYDTRSSE